MVTIAAAHSV